MADEQQESRNATMPEQRRERRMKEHEQWKDYWLFRDLNSRGTLGERYVYYLHRFFDIPVTWFRMNVSGPLQDTHVMPYYHRKISRVRTIDKCAANETACIWEANEQYRLDKSVDYNILKILRRQYERCVERQPSNSIAPCAEAIELYEENELNFFIKYGELGANADVRDAYMKQKHRMIWERRHPEIMAAREQLVAEHKKQLADGVFDFTFWKRGTPIQSRGNNTALPYEWSTVDTSPVVKENALSKDPQYYKAMREAGVADPDHPPGKLAGEEQRVPMFPIHS